MFAVRTALLFCLMTVFLAGCGGRTADDHAARAADYAAEGKVAEAIVEYRSAVQLEPRRGDIRLRLGDAYMRTEQFAEALNEYVRGADLLESDAQAHLKAASLMLIGGRFEDAKARASKAVAADPRNAEAQVVLGNAVAGLKDLDGAIAEYHVAIALQPDLHSGYEHLGTIQFARGDRAAAEATFRKAIEVAPRSVPARLAFANFLWSSERFAEAESELKTAVALEPKGVDANRALGIFYMLSGQAPLAEPHFKVVAGYGVSVSAKMSLANYYLVIGRAAEARAILREVAKAPAGYASATVRLAAFDAAGGNFAQAADALHQLLEKMPKEAGARLLKARIMLATDKRDAALAEVRRIVSDAQPSAALNEAYLTMGGIHASMGEYPQAVSAYEEVLKRQPRSLPAHVALAALHLANGSMDKASTYVEGALALAPQHPLSRSMAARVALAANDSATAKREIDGLRKDFPTASLTHNLVAAQHLAQDNVAAARAAFSTAARIDPRDIEPVAGLARVDLAGGRGHDAAKRLDAQIASVAEPGADLLSLGAQAHLVAGDYERAEQLLTQALEREPTRLELYERLGLLYVRARRVDDAIAQYRAAIERFPKSVSANTMLGMLLQAQRREGEAEKQYQHTLSIEPRAAVAANNLAWLYVSQNRSLDEARQLAESAYAALPDDAQVNDTLGWIYSRKNLTSQALRYLEFSANKAPGDANIHFHLGMTYLQAGEHDKARVALQRALSIQPNFAGSTEATNALLQLGK